MKNPGDIDIKDFFTQFTLRTPEGKVVIWGSIGNLVLATFVFLFPRLVPEASSAGTVALLSPLMLFFWHALSFGFGRLENRAFRISCLVVLSLTPIVKLIYDVFRT